MATNDGAPRHSGWGARLFALVLLPMSATAHARNDAPAPPGAGATAVGFAEMTGWATQDHDLIVGMLRRHCERPAALRAGVAPPETFGRICESLKEGQPASGRTFLEQHFQPYRITPESGEGFLTGYFEPEFAGSLAPSADYPVPVYDRPSDLVTRPQQDDGQWGHLGALQGARWADGRLAAYPDRASIDAGAIRDRAPVVLWMRDIVDRFVMQVQGSARIRLPDGGRLRLAYSGRNGHPYTSLGRVLVEEEGIPPAKMTMDRLVARLKSDLAAAETLIARNRSFVFFRRADDLSSDAGPIGGAGLPLTPHHSFAADRAIWPYGLPAMLHGRLPDGGGGLTPLARLGVIEDTGSAIVGPARIDLFFGSGEAAGHQAGLVRHPMSLTVLWPRP